MNAGFFEAVGVSKRFGGIAALTDVSLAVREGETVGLVGPNGAGKTTLFNCLLGVLRPDAGHVAFRGIDLTRMAVHRRARLGIGRTFQRVELFTGMTVREHLLVAERARRGVGGLFSDMVGRGSPTAAERSRVDRVLDLVGMQGEADLPVEALSLGRTRLVELGRALVGQPALLFLDEPSSGLDRSESVALAALLRTLPAQHGMAVLLVEHDLEMVAAVVTRLYVLDAGSLLAEGPVGEVLADEHVRRAYLGRAASP